MARFGIEEEFILLDEKTLVPLALSHDQRGAIVGDAADGEITAEYLTCQLESVLRPAMTLAEAAPPLIGMRRFLGTHAAALGAIAAPTGTPFIHPERFAVVRSDHYDEVAANLAEITRDQAVDGLHIHVEFADDEQRVRALNRIRPWLPTLLALTGNAPFSHGRPSGFASWRSILIRRLPSSWTPPRFEDFTHYSAHIAQLVEIGAIGDSSSLAWTVRLSQRFPTVEVRVFDAQLTAEDTLFAVALTRALLLDDDADAPGESHTVPVEMIEASLWTAARRGTDARLVDPLTGDIAPVWDIAERMLHHLRPLLSDLGDHDVVTERLERLRVEGTGAERQLRAYDELGVAGLADLYRAGTSTE